MEEKKHRLSGVIVAPYFRFFSKETKEKLLPDKKWKDVAVGELINYATPDGKSTSLFRKRDDEGMDWLEAEPHGDICFEPDWEDCKEKARAVRSIVYGPETYDEKVEMLGQVEEWPFDHEIAREVFAWEGPEDRQPKLEEFMALCYHGKFYVDLSPTELTTHRWRTIQSYLDKLSEERRKWTLESIDSTFHECLSLKSQAETQEDYDLAESWVPTDITKALKKYSNVIGQYGHPSDCPAFIQPQCKREYKPKTKLTSNNSGIRKKPRSVKSKSVLKGKTGKTSTLS